MTRLLSLGMIAALACACGGPNQTVAPTTTTPAPAVTLSGIVFDTAGRFVSGATVEIADGPRAGDSVHTDDQGNYSFGGTYQPPVTLRASKDGFVAKTEQAPKPPNNFQTFVPVNFTLAVPQPYVDVNGSYIATVDPGAACPQLSNVLYPRTYSAAISTDPTFPQVLHMTVTGGQLVASATGNFIGVAGDFVRFGLGLVHQLSPNEYLLISGLPTIAGATSNAPEYDAPFAGTASYCKGSLGVYDDDPWCKPVTPADSIECQADMRFTLVRQ